MPVSGTKEQRYEYSRAYNYEKYHNDPQFKQRAKDRTMRRRQENALANQEMVAEFRSAGCLLCPEKQDCCLQAHHIERTKKEFNISEAVRGSYTAKRMKAELSKCVCLCANCHMKLHAGLLTLTPVV